MQKDIPWLTNKQLNLIEQAQSIALFAHQNPDGDAYWSSLALQKILENMGKSAQVFLPDVSDVYAFLPGFNRIQTDFDATANTYDLYIILDCSTFDRLGKIYTQNTEYFTQIAQDKILVFDHHIPGSNAFVINSEHVIQCPWYASTCELVYDVFSPLYKTYFDKDSATALLLGVYTDTGGFKYGESPENSFRIAGELSAIGADRSLIVYEYMQARGLHDVQFAAYLIDRAKEYNTILYSSYSQKDLDLFGIDVERSTLGLNILQTVKWEGIILVVRYIDGKLKFSMRSRWELNVWAIANSMWWGWHKNAAGFSLNIWEVENYEEKVEEVLKSIEALLEN